MLISLVSCLSHKCEPGLIESLRPFVSVRTEYATNQVKIFASVIICWSNIWVLSLLAVKRFAISQKIKIQFWGWAIDVQRFEFHLDIAISELDFMEHFIGLYLSIIAWSSNSISRPDKLNREE